MVRCVARALAVVAGAMLVAIVMSDREAQAQAQTAPPAAAKRVLRVELAGPQTEVAAMQTVLRDVLAELAVAPEAQTVPQIDARAAVTAPAAPRSEGLVGYAFVDLTDPSRATLFLVDATRERILVRHLPRTANAEVLHETIGRVVGTGVEALLSGSFGEMGRPIEPARTPAAEPSPPPPPPRVSSVRSRVALAYEASLYADAQPIAHGPMLAGSIGLGARRARPTLWLTAQYRLPIVLEDAPVGARLDATALRMLAGVAIDPSPRLTLELGAGPGLDVTHIAPRLLAPSSVAFTTSDRWAAFFVTRAMAGATWRPVDGLSFGVALVVDVGIGGERFTVNEGAGDVAVLDPYVVRPGLALSLGAP